MSDKEFGHVAGIICLLLLVLLAFVIAGWAANAHEWNVAEDACIDHGHYFVEKFDERFYCVEHHGDGSKTSYWLDALEGH